MRFQSGFKVLVTCDVLSFFPDLLETLHCIASQSAVTSLVASGTSISNADLKDDELPGEFLDSSKLTAVQKYLTPDAWTSLQRAGTVENRT